MCVCVCVCVCVSVCVYLCVYVYMCASVKRKGEKKGKKTPMQLFRSPKIPSQQQAAVAENRPPKTSPRAPRQNCDVDALKTCLLFIPKANGLLKKRACRCTAQTSTIGLTDRNHHHHKLQPPQSHTHTHTHIYIYTHTHIPFPHRCFSWRRMAVPYLRRRN